MDPPQISFIQMFLLPFLLLVQCRFAMCPVTNAVPFLTTVQIAKAEWCFVCSEEGRRYTQCKIAKVFINIEHLEHQSAATNLPSLTSI